MGYGLHKAFKAVIKEILQYLSPLCESGSEVSYFIPEAINVSKVKKLSDNIKKPWMK